MILSQRDLRDAVANGVIRFDPAIEDRQWGEASVNLRLGRKFTKFLPANGATFSVAEGIKTIAASGLWHEEVFELQDGFGKPRRYRLEPDEFILGLTYERIWMPRHLIAMVEGRSTYARVGLSMHQTAPWIQPGWNGHVTLEIRNSGPFNIELTPIEDMPCQLTFFQLTSELSETEAYGSRNTNRYQDQASALPKEQG